MSNNDVRIQVGHPEQLTDAIRAALESFTRDDVTEALSESMDEVGKEAVKRLKSTSPKKKKNGGRYAKGWRYQRDKKNRLLLAGVVYNATDGSLTHLLEHGHPIVRNGVVVGRAKPIKHIEPVNTWVQEELVKKFTQKLK